MLYSDQHLLPIRDERLKRTK
uniref:Uncharacterized protein n=1 Tax=Arundo donax TaxID=35708 RepID=A0A0A9C2G6_ARUDO